MRRSKKQINRGQVVGFLLALFGLMGWSAFQNDHPNLNPAQYFSLPAGMGSGDWVMGLVLVGLLLTLVC